MCTEINHFILVSFSFFLVKCIALPVTGAFPPTTSLSESPVVGVTVGICVFYFVTYILL